MRDPGEQPRPQHVRAPDDRMPGDILIEPALDQLDCRLAGICPGGKQIGKPAKAVPGGEPFGSGGGREPARRRISDHFAVELDFPRGNRRAALWIARPSLAELELELAGNPSDQGVAIESGGGEGLQRVMTQSRPQALRIAAESAPRSLVILDARRIFHPSSP